MSANESELDINAIEEQVDQFIAQFIERSDWAARQGADIRGKAELMQRLDDPPEVYGTADPEHLLAVAEKLDRLYGLSRHGKSRTLMYD